MYRFILPVLAGFIFFTAQSQTFTELTDTKPRDSEAAWRRLKNNYNFSWGNTDTRYPKYIIPVKQGMENLDGGGTAIRLTAWRGERVNAQAVLYVKDAWKDVSVKVSDLRSGSHIIPSAQIKISPVAYVMTDELNKDGKGGCGHRPDPTKFDSSIVADILDHHVPGFTVEANSTRPVWVSVDVPANVQPGNYKGTLTATGAGSKPLSLSISIQVLNRTLPDASKWSFHLDLWQNPYAVARFHNVPLWSREHFDHMRPLMKMLAGAGQSIYNIIQIRIGKVSIQPKGFNYHTVFKSWWQPELFKNLYFKLQHIIKIIILVSTSQYLSGVFYQCGFYLIFVHNLSCFCYNKCTQGSMSKADIDKIFFYAFNATDKYHDYP